MRRQCFGGAALTQVIQGPWSPPNAIFHAGSSDWKNSSGWKNVRTVRALTRRKAMRRRRMFEDGDDGDGSEDEDAS